MYLDKLSGCQCFFKYERKCYTYQFGAKILAGKYGTKICEGRKITPWMDILSAGENLCQMLGVGKKGMRGTPVRNTYPKKKIVCVPLVVGWVVKLGQVGHPLQQGGAQQQFSSWDKYFQQGCLPLPTPNIWHKFSPAVSMSIPGVISAFTYFDAIFSCQNVGTKLVTITFSLRPEEALLVLTSRMLVWIYY